MKYINMRFKDIRSALGYSQEKLGLAIGLSRSGVSNIENGSREVTERHIKLLNHELNINEDWLRHGTGDMFAEKDLEVLSTLSKDFNLDKTDQRLIEKYLYLSANERKTIKDYIRSVFME